MDKDEEEKKEEEERWNYGTLYLSLSHSVYTATVLIFSHPKKEWGLL